MNLEEIYKKNGAYLEGHFLLSSGKHSQFYLQSAKILENPSLAKELCQRLLDEILSFGIEFDSVCSPAIGGLLAGYELASVSKKRFIFTERVNLQMTLRRGFEIKKGEKFIICEDVITTGGSALESAKIIEENGGVIVAYAALANRGFCPLKNLKNPKKDECKLPTEIPIFALGNFDFEIYDEKDCPLCKNGSKPIKAGSRGN